jgi:nucleotide-binding universal stress UspA family protein
MNETDSVPRMQALGVGERRAVVLGLVTDAAGPVEYAVTEARLLGSPLRVVHTVDALRRMDTTKAAETRDARARLGNARATIETYGPDVRATFVLRRGSASRVLAEESVDAHEIVLASDGTGGRTSAHVVDYASSTVVMVPDESTPLPEQDILVMIHAETSAHGPLRYAFEVAAARAQSLRIVALGAIGDDGPDDGSWDTFGWMIDSWRARYPDVDVSTATIDSRDDTTLSDIASRAGLTVVGRGHDRTIPALPNWAATAHDERRLTFPLAVVPANYAG